MRSDVLTDSCRFSPSFSPSFFRHDTISKRFLLGDGVELPLHHKHGYIPLPGPLVSGNFDIILGRLDRLPRIPRLYRQTRQVSTV